MKALFIAYNQAYNEEIVEILENNGQRGFTRWEDIQGRGSVDGKPHMGSHGWPEMNHAMLTMVSDDKVEGILDDLRSKDAESPELGIRAYVLNIEMFL